MKTIKLLLFVSVVLLAFSCERSDSKNMEEYVFVQPYSAYVTVGGVVGVQEKHFLVGDTVSGYKPNKDNVVIRIAGHSDLNEGPPAPWSYQEFLEVPSGYLKALK